MTATSPHITSPLLDTLAAQHWYVITHHGQIRCGCWEWHEAEGLNHGLTFEQHIAAATLDLAHPTVTTAAELDALPDHAIVVDAEGEAWQKSSLVGEWAGGYGGSDTSEGLLPWASLTVLWTGGQP